MTELSENTKVHVPSKSVGLGYDYPSAMVECRFKSVLRQKGIVDQVPGTDDEFTIDLRLISEKLGFLIVQLGDFNSEELLLEPLHQTVTTMTELVLLPEYVWKCRIRSIEEFEKFWSMRAGVISHLVIVGHGSKSGLIFGSTEIKANDFVNTFQSSQVDGQAPIIISLCCKSGNGIFGKNVSGSPNCRAFIGPSGSIHASNASSFYQSFILHSLLEGFTNNKAYQLSRVFTPGVTEFNMWVKKKLIHKPSRKNVLGY